LTTALRDATRYIAFVVPCFLIVLAGCAHPLAQPGTSAPAATPTSALPGTQFVLVTKSGIEIACPFSWQLDSDPALVYGAHLDSTTRIIVAVLDALPESYYEGLVSSGAIRRTAIAGCLAYQNDYVYPLGSQELISRCITIVQGEKACHVMFLCDTTRLSDIQPVLDAVLASVKFI